MIADASGHAASLDAAAPELAETEQVEDDAAHSGKVANGIFHPGAGLVVVKASLTIWSGTPLTAKGADLKSLAEPWADTTSPAGKMILTVLAGIAEFERSLIISRTSEGRAAAIV